MRTIKFRLWNTKLKKMRVLKSLSCYYDQDFFTNPYGILLQYTGCKDKNGEEIFDGDIIQNDRGSILTVAFEEGCFYVTGKDGLNGSEVNEILNVFNSWSVIIGNIYEGIKEDTAI